MKAWILEHAFNLVVGPLVGIVVYFIHENLQKVVGWLDAQGPWIKRGIALALSAILTPLATALGTAIPDICTKLSTEDVLAQCVVALADKQWLTVVLGGLFAIAFHKAVSLTKGNAKPQGV